MSADELLPDFSALRVGVVGDLVADHDLFARPRRLSREAPVLVLRHERDVIGPGGAANVAANLAALGARVRVFGALGRDASGREVRHQLEAQGIDTRGLELTADWVTPTKTRILAAEARRSRQQILRIDREPSAPAPPAVRARIADALLGAAGELDALLVADYDYGLARGEVAAAVGAVARRGATVVLDPRDVLDEYAGVAAMTPNVGELARFVGCAEDELDDPRRLRDAAQSVLERAGVRWVLVTRGNAGMALFGEGVGAEGVAVPASGGGEVTDVCGAGDTAAAVFALALASGTTPVEAMVFANAASGVVVMEHGAASCSREALAGALEFAPTAGPLAPTRNLAPHTGREP